MKSFKALILGAVVVASFGFVTAEARELTYKTGVGYRLAYSGAFVDDTTNTATDGHLQGIEAVFGVSQDMLAGAYFGFSPNFGSALVGPSFRYDIHRLFNRDASVWHHLNIFVEAKFLAKLGGDIKAGITLHLPYFGFEILPFSNNNFAILTAAGVSVDFVKKTKIGMTDNMFGDVGVRYYF